MRIGRCDLIEPLGRGPFQSFAGTCRNTAQQGFEFAPGLLDGREARRVGKQIPQAKPSCLKLFPDTAARCGFRLFSTTMALVLSPLAQGSAPDPYSPGRDRCLWLPYCSWALADPPGRRLRRSSAARYGQRGRCHKHAARQVLNAHSGAPGVYPPRFHRQKPNPASAVQVQQSRAGTQLSSALLQKFCYRARMALEWA